MPNDESYGDSLFTHSSNTELERLEALCAAFDRVTFFRLGSLEFGLSARCLDVGAGTASVARWLAERTHEKVVALDRGQLAKACAPPPPNLHFIFDDVAACTLEPASFNLIHSRFFLMHLRNRESILDRMVSWLAPGGWLIVSDCVDITTPAKPASPYHAVMAAMWRALKETIGTDFEWCLRYPRPLQDRGLVDVGVEVYLPHIGNATPMARFWELTWTALRPRLLSEGIEAHLFDQALACLRDPGFVELSPGMITAWGRRPLEAEPAPREER